MIPKNRWDVEWIVAVLAPWTISPHPNFGVKDIGAPERLALVAESRAASEIRRGESQVLEVPSWAEMLIEHARNSLLASSQISSTQKLVEIAEDTSLPPGARAASAIFASISFCDLDLHGIAIELITRLLEEWRVTETSNIEFTASQRLIVASLLMQKSTRLAECCRYQEALKSVREVLKWLPSTRETKLEEFKTSKGISWSSSTVQRDIIRSVKRNALSLLSYLEDIGGNTWVQLVRSRESWVDSRRYHRSADRDQIVLRDTFEKRIEATSSTRHFGRITAREAGYRSLTLAELSGDFGLMQQERESLGKILILDHAKEPSSVKESLRLFRQGRASRSLSATVSWIRGQGPSQALVDDSISVSTRANRDHWCTEQDLIVLEGAAEFLTSTQKDNAISAALLHAQTPQPASQRSWIAWERQWKTVSRLLPGSARHSDIAKLVLDQVDAMGSLHQSAANTVARLIVAVDWSQVDSEIKTNWLIWAEKTEKTTDNEEIFAAITQSISSEKLAPPSKISIDLAAYLADEGDPDSSEPEEISAVSAYLVELLQREVTTSAKGMISYGGYQNLNVSVAFALRFNPPELWESVLEHLLDKNIDAALKDLATDRLAENHARLPKEVGETIRSGITLLLDSPRKDSMFTQGSSIVFTQGLRLAAALDALPTAEVLDFVLQLAASGPRDRIEAAKTIPFCIAKSDATWGHALLLQLSHDDNPTVRAVAGYNLARSLASTSALSDAVYARIDALLGADGLKVPLAMLQGIQRIAAENRTECLPLRAGLTSLLTEQVSPSIQNAARDCLDQLQDKMTDSSTQ